MNQKCKQKKEKNEIENEQREEELEHNKAICMCAHEMEIVERSSKKKQVN